jgi:hypothetical protein
MAITVSNPNNITSPIGNALAIFKDSSTNNFFVVDINGKTESLERALGQESLQEVLDVGNSALQDMTVNGKITFGESNTNNGTRSFIAGSSNTISSGNNFVIGDSNTNSGVEGIVIGNSNSLINNTTTSVLIGKSNNSYANENVYLIGNSLDAQDNSNTYFIGDNIDSGASSNSFAFGQNLDQFNSDSFQLHLGEFSLDETKGGYLQKITIGVGRDASNKENALVIWKETSSPFSNLFDVTGKLLLNNYGSGNITGTATYRLGVDVSGNVIEVSDGGGTVTAIATTSPITGGTITSAGTIGITQSSASTDGYLSSTDWNTFNNKTSNIGTVTSVGLGTGTVGTDVNVTGSPITSSGSFTLNIPFASATNNGKLSSTDWSTFNSKQNALTLGDLTETSSNVLVIIGGVGSVIGFGTSISVTQATTLSDGYLSSTDWNTFNSKQNALSFGDLTETTSSILTIVGGTNSVIGSGTTIEVAQANASTSGFLSSTDWNTFNNKTSNVGTVTSVGLGTGTVGTDVNVTGSPITSSGSFTLNIPFASATNNGKLSSTDWSTFNSKQNALSFGDLTEATSSILTIVGGTNSVIGSGTTIEVAQADASTSGFLSSTDWNTFNNKQNAFTGTTNTIPIFTSSSTIGDSQITDNGTDVNISSNRNFNATRNFGSNEFNAKIDVGSGLNAGLVALDVRQKAYVRGGMVISPNPTNIEVDNSSLVIGSGSNDIVNGSDHCLTVGSGNQILDDSDRSVSFGNNNESVQSDNSMNVGNTNILRYSNNSHIIGQNNQMGDEYPSNTSGLNNSLIIGSDNLLLTDDGSPAPSNGSLSFVIGHDNDLRHTLQNSFSFGYSISNLGLSSTPHRNDFNIGGDLIGVNQTMTLGYRNDTTLYPTVNRNAGLGETKFVVAVGSSTTTNANALLITEGGVSGGGGGTVPQIPRIIMPTIVNFNYTNDTNAGANGIPIGGLYHTSGTLKIRLT